MAMEFHLGNGSTTAVTDGVKIDRPCNRGRKRSGKNSCDCIRVNFKAIVSL